MEGHKYIWKEKCLSLWSAPNYCYRCGNKASIIYINDNHSSMIKTYEAVKVKNIKKNIIYLKNRIK